MAGEDPFFDEIVTGPPTIVMARTVASHAWVPGAFLCRRSPPPATQICILRPCLITFHFVSLGWQPACFRCWKQPSEMSSAVQGRGGSRSIFGQGKGANNFGRGKSSQAKAGKGRAAKGGIHTTKTEGFNFLQQHLVADAQQVSRQRQTEDYGVLHPVVDYG